MERSCTNDELANLLEYHDVRRSAQNYERNLTENLFEQSVAIAKQRAVYDNRYSYLATCLRLTRMQRQNEVATFSEFVHAMRDRLADSFVAFVEKHSQELDIAVEKAIDLDFFKLDCFGIETLRKGYLLHKDNLIELPCYLQMRCAITTGLGSIDTVLTTFELLSHRRATFATPVMFNSGAKRKAQLASCFLVAMTDKEDSIDGGLRLYTNAR